jgi:hypothetical protein
MRNFVWLGKYRMWAARIVPPVLALASLMVIQAKPVSAASPNDTFANATPISSLPFSDTGSLNGNTTEPDEPQQCNILAQTAWYAFTPTGDTVVRADLDGSDFGIGLNVYKSLASGFTGLQFLGCIGTSGSFNLTAQAGATYYIQVGTVSQGTANFQLHVQEIPRPPNDDFANATPITAVPFSDTVEHLIAGTVEPNEPLPCAGGEMLSTVWWAFTPTSTASYSASFAGPLSPQFAVYTGSSLAELDLQACSSGSDITFQASAGTTYYLRAAGAFTLDFPMFFQLDVTPAPIASFFFIPPDPSIFDPVQFLDSSSDPARVGIQSQAWAFGDGVTAEGCCPTHQYARDGDYTVELTVTTPDGRTASTSQVVQVRTHDVAIARIGVPRSAQAGHTISVNVSVRNTRYPEIVQVDLFKTVPAGFEQAGSLTRSVMVNPGNSTTQFQFAYVVSDADRSLGKVTFKAVATIIDHRDTLPGDNEMISSAVRVT